MGGLTILVGIVALGLLFYLFYMLFFGEEQA